MATTTADNIQIIGGVDVTRPAHRRRCRPRRKGAWYRIVLHHPAGYRAMLRWFRSHGGLRVGNPPVPTGRLALSGIPVLEVTGPDPASRCQGQGRRPGCDLAAAEAARTRRRVQARERPFRHRGSPVRVRRRERRGWRSSAAARPCRLHAWRHRCRTGAKLDDRVQPHRHAAPARPVRPGGRDTVGGASRPGGPSTKLSLKSLARNPRHQRRDR